MAYVNLSYPKRIVVFAISVVLLLAFETVVSNDIHSSDPNQNCYVAPSCSSEGDLKSDPLTGFTNLTGWQPPSSTQPSCCQICTEVNKIVCFNEEDEDCQSKTGQADYDYLLFDQIWLPQLCKALTESHDPTLTHLDGSLCVADAVRTTNLSIHGLWPNYYSGYPSCCSEGSTVQRLHPTAIESWDIYPQIREQWVEPTVSSSQGGCSTCYNLNHEWEKHGGCFSPNDPEKYFSTGLLVNSLLEPKNSIINSLSGSNTTVSFLKSQYYPYQVNVICDPKDPENSGALGIFLEIQSCWITAAASSHIDSVQNGFERVLPDITLSDCSPATPMDFTTPCPENIFIRQ